MSLYTVIFCEEGRYTYGKPEYLTVRTTSFGVFFVYLGVKLHLDPTYHTWTDSCFDTYIWDICHLFPLQLPQSYGGQRLVQVEAARLWKKDLNVCSCQDTHIQCLNLKAEIFQIYSSLKYTLYMPIQTEGTIPTVWIWRQRPGEQLLLI